MADRAHPLPAQAGNAAECSAVVLAPAPSLTRLAVRAGQQAAIALAGMLRVALPTTPCRSRRTSERAALWLGPDEWLVLAEDGTAFPTAHAGASIVDVSHRDTALSVSGPRAAWAINAFCALDLHSAAFPVGMCTRTAFGKAQIVLWRTGDESFHIEVARSFAPYVWACLEEARREFLA
jgi:heterotetrameric sarcosine oxidase gamma subunit